MSWRDRYVDASFRGVPFLTERHEANGGRRIVLHEFPQRDLPYAEDLGRRARRWSIDALIVGADYMDGRDRLLTALEERGAGQLVHPYLGEKSVAVEDFTLTESTEQGGMAIFRMAFVESGESVRTEQRPDTGDRVDAVAAAAIEAAPSRFADRFSVAGLPAFVEQGAAGIVGQFVQSSEVAGRLLGGAGVALRTYETGLGALNGAIALVRQPVQLALNVRGMLRALGQLGTLPLLRVRALGRMINDVRGYRTVIGSTPARLAENSNRSAFIDLVATIAAAEAVRSAATVSFASYGEAVELRDWLSDVLELAAVNAADAGDDDQATALDDLRFAMVRDVSERGASLARLKRIVPAVTEPALVIANRIYGSGSVAARAGAIVARNPIRHPGFVPGAIPIDVLTAPEAGRG